MRNRVRIAKLLAAILGLTVLLAACGGEKYAPQAINEETDVCAICKMSIKDNQYATQIITTDGQALKFDDLGCLNAWRVENGTDTIGATYVRDFHTKKWIAYEDAYYAYDASYSTPMAYGILSFEQEADAQAYISEQGAGMLMTASQLAEHSWAVNHEMMDMGGHGDSRGDSHGVSHGDSHSDSHSDSDDGLPDDSHSHGDGHSHSDQHAADVGGHGTDGGRGA